MAGVNKVILVGNLGKDPELKYLEGNIARANFSIATSEFHKDKNGNKIEQPSGIILLFGEVWQKVLKNY